MLTIAIVCALMLNVVWMATVESASPEVLKMIEQINQNTSLSWTAQVPQRFQNLDDFKTVLGALEPTTAQLNELKQKSPVAAGISSGTTLPTSFDARVKWPECKTIGEVLDQGSCGSCWAFSSSQVITDRICIANNGTKNQRISMQDLLSCCATTCGSQCDGGYTTEALKWYVSSGIVTGGGYNSNIGCLPYQFSSCNDDTACTFSSNIPDKCQKKCRSGYNISYSNDKNYGADAYWLKSNSMQNIMLDIMNYGPAVAQFSVYKDFYTYKSGVYTQTSTSKVGAHAIKIIGWGEENSVKYWLIVNSWGTIWGEAGLFKIRRGTNEAGIEDLILTVTSSSQTSYVSSMNCALITLLINIFLYLY